jgi:hypothetical protein
MWVYLRASFLDRQPFFESVFCIRISTYFSYAWSREILNVTLQNYTRTHTHVYVGMNVCVLACMRVWIHQQVQF